MIRSVFVFLLTCGIGCAFHLSSGFLRHTHRHGVFYSGPTDTLKLGEPMLEKTSPVLDAALKKAKQVVVPNSSESDCEQLFRKYPYAWCGLPLLQDHDNYYSGTFQDIFWHQNTDNVFVFIPVDEKVSRNDVNVKFEALQVQVTIAGVDIATFPTHERCIPDGSFWTFERDKEGKRYLHIDLEKRFRMINWNRMFGEAETKESTDALFKKSKFLEKLQNANQGMSKLSGLPAETMQELMSNEELNRMIANSEECEDGEDDPAADEVLDLERHKKIAKMLGDNPDELKEVPLNKEDRTEDDEASSVELNELLKRFRSEEENQEEVKDSTEGVDSALKGASFIDATIAENSDSNKNVTNLDTEGAN